MAENNNKERCCEVFNKGVGVKNVEIEEVIRFSKRNASRDIRTQLPMPGHLLVKLRYVTDIPSKA